jgi:hypothetical protein
LAGTAIAEASHLGRRSTAGGACDSSAVGPRCQRDVRASSGAYAQARSRVNPSRSLSHLTFEAACKLLGPRGAQLIRTGGQLEIDPLHAVPRDAKRFELRIPPSRGNAATVTLSLASDHQRWLHWRCSACTSPCEHVGAAFSVVLEDKILLGLAEPPPEIADGPNDLVERAIVREQLAGAVDTDAAGRPVLALTLPDRATLDGIAQLLGGLLQRASGSDTVLN